MAKKSSLPESGQPVRCNVAKREWKPCAAVSKALDDTRANGLVSKMLMNFSNGTATTIPVLHSGEFAKKGIVLNFCPFCGESLERLYRR